MCVKGSCKDKRILVKLGFTVVGIQGTIPVGRWLRDFSFEIRHYTTVFRNERIVHVRPVNQADPVLATQYVSTFAY